MRGLPDRTLCGDGERGSVAVSRSRASPRAAVAVKPRAGDGFELRLDRLLPSARSLLLGLALVAAAAGAYLLARDTSLFAVRDVEVRGAPPALAAQVRTALEPLAGRSLLRISATDVRARLASLPQVASVSGDRHFPHTLRVLVVPELALAVARQGSDAWLISAEGRILRALPHPRLSLLPRIWLPRRASVDVGGTVDDVGARTALRALAPLRGHPFLRRVRDVRADAGELTLVLRSGLELRLGDTSNLRLKLAISQQIVPDISPPGYLDVSVPARPVSSVNPKVGG